MAKLHYPILNPVGGRSGPSKNASKDPTGQETSDHSRRPPYPHGPEGRRNGRVVGRLIPAEPTPGAHGRAAVPMAESAAWLDPTPHPATNA